MRVTAPKSASRSFGGDLLRVVQQGQRPNAVTAQRRVVEQDAGNDERAGERSATGLIRTRDEAHTEPPVVREKTLAARTSHASRR